MEHILEYDEFLNESYGIKDLKSELSRVKKEFEPNHRAHKQIDNFFNEVKSNDSKIKSAFKKFDYQYKLKTKWRDNRTSVDLTVLIGVNKHDIVKAFEDEKNEFRQRYKYAPLDGFVADKIAELAKSKGAKVKGGGDGYSTFGDSYVYLWVATTDIN